MDFKDIFKHADSLINITEEKNTSTVGTFLVRRALESYRKIDTIQLEMHQFFAKKESPTACNFKPLSPIPSPKPTRQTSSSNS
jgi:hypothetical protein